MSGFFPDRDTTSWSCNLPDLKQRADEGDAIAQWQYGFCLLKGEGVSLDLQNAAQYFKLSAAQGNAVMASVFMKAKVFQKI
jgi:TPR repeat protein